ncbi:MAG: trypsin-like peptidase domain-containing protein [Acidimicrobiales bacterium]|nr:trypsin-like peptidase domain-containing protein [Acidimicrobiales bacterium]
MALFPPHWLDCVVALGEPDAAHDDGVHWMATGFFYVHVTRRDGDHVTGKAYLVTARHVIGDRPALLLRVNPSAAEPARTFRVALRDDPERPDQPGGEPPLWFHPDDDALDVAIIPVDLGLLRSQGMRAATFFSDTDLVDRGRLAAEGVSEGDGVFVLGFPMGDVGGERNHAIVRGGTIARVRDALAGTIDTMLLDCFVFPGNSGGPVILRPERTTIEGTPSPQRALLLGLVRSYVPYRDVATSSQTGRARIVFEENTGLCSATLIDVVADLARRQAGT